MPESSLGVSNHVLSNFCEMVLDCILQDLIQMKMMILKVSIS